MYVFAAAAGGIACDRYTLWSEVAASWQLVLASIAWGGWWWAFRRHRRRGLAVGLLLAAVFFLAAAWHHDRWNLFSEQEIGHLARDRPRPVAVEGVATHAPRWVPASPDDPHRAYRLGEQSTLTLRVTAIRDRDQWRPASGRVRLRVQGHVLAVGAGDRLRVFAQLRRPQRAANPGQFDVARYARGDRLLAQLSAMHPDCVRVLARGPQFSVQRFLDSVRKQGDLLIWRFVGEQHGGIARAILLGAREGLPVGQTDPFMRTGTIHLLVVSGLHVGILAMALFSALQFGMLRRGLALLLIAAIVAGYAMLADARPPVTRAATLSILACLALATGRRIIAYNSLAAAGLVVLALNPSELFRTGPQLSFIAVATLIAYGNLVFLPARRDPLLRLKHESDPAWLRFARGCFGWAFHIMLATLCVWLTALPLVMRHFHIVAPIAVLISPLIWLVTWAALLSGFALLATGWIAAGWATACGWLCQSSLAVLDQVVQSARGVPGGHFWTTGPDAWWVAGCYLLLAWPLWIRWPAIRPRWRVAVMAAWTLAGLTPALLRSDHSGRLDVAFVALGHGACVVLELPGGATVLYDAGNLTSPEQGVRTIASYLWAEGIETLDAIILSHADIDHYNAVPGLLERFRVGTVVVGPTMFAAGDDPGMPNDTSVAPGAAAESLAVAKLRMAIDRAGATSRTVSQGDRIVIAGEEAEIRVRHPPAEGVAGSDNANSLVLEIVHAGRRILLPGDLEPPGLEELLMAPPTPCDVLLAPHHGSRHSDPAAVAAWANPAWVIISGGDVSGVETAVSAYQAASARVLKSQETGMIRCHVTPDGRLHFHTFRSTHSPTAP